MNSSKRVNNLAKRVVSEYKQSINSSYGMNNQGNGTQSGHEDGCEQARHAERTIKQQMMTHERNLEIQNSYREIDDTGYTRGSVNKREINKNRLNKSKLSETKETVKSEERPSISKKNNLRNAMIMSEILSQPVCKRRKKSR